MSHTMSPERKAEIDAMDYKDMLYQCRFAPIGDKTFQGAAGAYFLLAMADKGDAISAEECVRISKSIGHNLKR